MHSGPDGAPETGEESNGSVPYRLEPVATTRQRVVFVVMQTVFLATLLLLSAKIIAVFLSPLAGSMTVRTVLVIYCASAIFWQLTYVYRMLAMKRPVLVDRTVPTGLRLAMATTIVPSREFDLLREKLEGMVAVDPCGNELDHWVLDEEDDPRVRSMIDEFNARYGDRGIRFAHFTRKGTARYNEAPSGRRFKQFQTRQKGGNINAWLDATRDSGYDVISFMDLDHVPVADFYRKVLPYFRDRDVAFVQGPESFRNRNQNFITRAASLERDAFFGLIHRSYFGLGMPVIVGSHTTFRASTFEALGGSYPVHLTEDYLIMLRLWALEKRGIFIDDILAVGELPSTWSAYLGQQQRWASGGLDLLIRYLPPLLRGFSWKRQLFAFSLANYYAWGTFFMLAKVVLLSMAIGGLTVTLESGLIVGIVAFTAIAMIANHLWEKQFFVEPEQETFLLENSAMNNFLGGLYFLSLIKALIAPNSPFNVTAKSGTSKGGVVARISYPVMAASLLAIETGGLALAWAGTISSDTAITAGFDIVKFPLVVSVVANLWILAAMRTHERESKPWRHRLFGMVEEDPALVTTRLPELDS